MLHDYQKKAVEFIRKTGKVALFLNTGLGKTLIALHARHGKTLVIAPARVAEYVWSKEIDKWGLPLIYSIVKGNKVQRLKALEKFADIYIISRDNVVWLFESKHLTWETIIIDELSSFKDSKTKRFKALRKFKAKNVIGLTATPTSNKLIDIWAQMHLINKDLLGYKKDFLAAYFTPILMNGYVDHIPKTHAKIGIYEQIKPNVMKMTKKEGLPEITYNNEPIFLAKSERAYYEALKRDFIIEFKDQVVTAANSATLMNKLLQLTSGEVYAEDKQLVKVHNQKIEALTNLIEAQNGNPLVVFYAYKHEKRRIIELATKLKLELTERDFDGWNDKKYDILLVHPASCAYGLNLQKGGSTIVWFTLTWSLELHEQANARLHRQGQTEPVVVKYMLVENSVDEYVLQCIKRKDKDQKIFLGLFKELGLE